uniref:Uncharacterized protein n=1 Tax=Caenorhabditis japonica TaxID=281687 RepID=A0A8R1ECM0_CAEJA
MHTKRLDTCSYRQTDRITRRPPPHSRTLEAHPSNPGSDRCNPPRNLFFCSSFVSPEIKRVERRETPTAIRRVDVARISWKRSSE